VQGSSKRFRRVFFGSAMAVAAAVLLVAGVTSAALSAQPKTHAGPTHFPFGYPPPGGIYTGMTRCPLYNQIMHESVQFTACVVGDATTGSITLGNITTTVTEPVNVQFGFYTAANQTFYADVVPPPEGLQAQLVTKPDLIPMSLSTALGCATTTSTVVESLCKRIPRFGKFGNEVYALAESDGAITNFDLLSWTQPVVFQLLNPLLGPDCTIGTLGDPVLLQPQLSISSLTQETDPNPTAHPDTFVLATQATASATTFAAPAVTGCGPGGVANIAVDEALDASAGLPAASGNSLTLTGTFNIAACEASEDSTLTQPQDDAAILLSAFRASVGTPPPSASKRAAGRLSAAGLRQEMLRLLRVR
jgi:hypothetical protein